MWSYFNFRFYWQSWCSEYVGLREVFYLCSPPPPPCSFDLWQTTTHTKGHALEPLPRNIQHCTQHIKHNKRGDLFQLKKTMMEPNDQGSARRHPVPILLALDSELRCAGQW